ncbi:MAG TPA: hypothetical protein VME19_10205 [Streptosporangiaceae bacterium]|nr:hypothetical protein [Streptosporangiaceae bacterium]
MRFGTKTAIAAAFAGPAIAALILTGAGAASASVTTTSNPGPFCNQGQYQPGYGHGHGQNQFQQEQWNLSGSNTNHVKFEVNTYDYSMYISQEGSCLTGWMTDPGASFTGRIHGTVYGNFVTFSITYPYGSKQGTRTFNGTINQWGHVSGSWSETGSENASGSWWLSNAARPGCQMTHYPNYPGNQYQYCNPYPGVGP